MAQGAVDSYLEELEKPVKPKGRATTKK
jgi:hypothetical protein